MALPSSMWVKKIAAFANGKSIKSKLRVESTNSIIVSKNFVSSLFRNQAPNA